MQETTIPKTNKWACIMLFSTFVKRLIFEKNHRSRFRKTEFSINILNMNIYFEYGCTFLTSEKDRFKKIKKV